MKKILVAAAAFVTLQLQAQTKWNVDASHSNVKFEVTHLVVSEMDGSFKVYNGTINSPSADFQGAQVEFAIDVNSINTDNERRDGHLKGDDFFNAEKYPKMTFKSVSFKKVSGSKYELVGDLTIRDVTKRVTFDVTYGGTTKDPWGNTKAGFKASATIDRLAYGLKWNTLTEAGGAVVGKDVKINVKLEFNQAKS
ncbi:MAG: polyisoprenoid-binding protein [Bacteroidetes bacterium]|jgi:polyisoprenoid-binding protein YceI|nr:MAG: polyisoprenoid-binding protein [Bacteroidota bacterium]TAE71691.1 MAG: polyisoprenoid-binding protein [Bacteroidota bacterium]TAF94461.1 MAG: polyisoprenoid-binding protein [Bacteroidota bacterium]